MHITILGTGLMGAALAGRLTRQGHRVLVWNRTITRAESLGDGNVGIVSDPREAIVLSEAIVLTLSDAAAIETVLSMPGVLAALSDRVVVQMGTVSPEQSRSVSVRLKEVGAEYLEAPVLGSRSEAASGTLLIMAGGAPAVFSRCLPWLRDCGADPVLVGPVGQAAGLKLALNQLIASLTTGFALSLGLLRAEGIEVEAFMRILRESALFAPTFDKKLARIQERDFSSPNFPLKHLLKDVELCREMAESIGLQSTVLDAISQVLAQGVREGYAEDDYAALSAIIIPDSRYT